MSQYRMSLEMRRGDVVSEQAVQRTRMEERHLKLSCLPIWSLCVGLAACSDTMAPNLGPATPTIAYRAMAVDSGGALQITAVATIPTKAHLQVAVPPQCPLGVAVFPDPTGAFMMPAGTTIANCA